MRPITAVSLGTHFLVAEGVFAGGFFALNGSRLLKNDGPLGTAEAAPAIAVLGSSAAISLLGNSLRLGRSNFWRVLLGELAGIVTVGGVMRGLRDNTSIPLAVKYVGWSLPPVIGGLLAYYLFPTADPSETGQ